MAFTIPNDVSASFANQARVDSGDVSVLVDGLNGVGVLSGCLVSPQGAPDMTVAVAAGSVRVGGATRTVAAGNVTVSANSSGNTRIDLIAVNSSGVKSVQAGSAGAVPVYPATAGFVVLARVEVPSGITAVTSNHLTDKRVFVGSSVPGPAELLFLATNYV